MNSFEVFDVPAMPHRHARPATPKIVEASCANCDARYGLPRCRRSPYCTARCHDQAKYVRYARAKRREYGENLPADISYALRVKRLHALGESYDDSARRISPARRREVWIRDGGLCTSCGEPGEEIDHRDGPSDELANLQLMCRPCHRRKTAAKVVLVGSASGLVDAMALRMRERSSVALRPCDSEDWSLTWRAWQRVHRTEAESTAGR